MTDEALKPFVCPECNGSGTVFLPYDEREYLCNACSGRSFDENIDNERLFNEAEEAISDLDLTDPHKAIVRLLTDRLKAALEKAAAYDRIKFFVDEYSLKTVAKEGTIEVISQEGLDPDEYDEWYNTNEVLYGCYPQLEALYSLGYRLVKMSDNIHRAGSGG